MFSSLGYREHGLESMGYIVSRVPGYRVLGMQFLATRSQHGFKALTSSDDYGGSTLRQQQAAQRAAP